MKTYSVITGTGRYIPTECVKNEDFLSKQFYTQEGVLSPKSNREIIDKFIEITTIAERRYVSDDIVTSDIAYISAIEALKSAEINKEDLDYIIVAHNFGDIKKGNKVVDIVPSVASRVKYKLGIQNPNTVAYDITFGCPGWLQAVIQADYFIKSGDAKKILVIGAETLSRISDPHDVDSMIYADGSGAVIIEAKDSTTPIGILKHKTRSDTSLHSKMLYMGKSYNPNIEENENSFLKMNGRRLYQYALENVPSAIKNCLDENGTDIRDIKKLLIHQANGKMDDAILERLYNLYGINNPPENIMPMTISWLGNSSVATVPTLLDLVIKGELENHQINSGDLIILASVGAGMNINTLIYKA